MNVVALLLSGLTAYLLGSVDFGILVSRGIYHQDIRKFGSGNAGMTNILRTFGKKAAALTLAGDMLKGTASVLLAKYLFCRLAPTLAPMYLAYTAAICALLGHLFPLYFHFKGGKGVSVAAGAILGLNIWVILPLLLVFLVMVAATRIVSLSSITVAALYPVVTCVYYQLWGAGQGDPWMNTLFAAVVAGLVIFMHRANIVRLANGTEYKFGQKKAQ